MGAKAAVIGVTGVLSIIRINTYMIGCARPRPKRRRRKSRRALPPSLNYECIIAMRRSGELSIDLTSVAVWPSFQVGGRGAGPPSQGGGREVRGAAAATAGVIQAQSGVGGHQLEHGCRREQEGRLRGGSAWRRGRRTQLPLHPERDQSDTTVHQIPHRVRGKTNEQ